MGSSIRIPDFASAKPYNYQDYDQPGADAVIRSAQTEWDTMLSRRVDLVNNIASRLNLANQLHQADPSMNQVPGMDLKAADHTVNQHMIDGQNADGSLTMYQRLMEAPHQEEMNQLLGAADFWGIQNADKIPPQALKKIVEARRLQSGELDDRGMNPATDIALTSMAAAGLGASQGLIEMAQHIPFIGHAIAANQTVQKSSQWLASLNEGVQAGMTENERSGYRIAHGLGGMLGYIVPAEAAWQAAGAVGSLGALGTAGSLGRFVTSPIARAAIQGAASTWMLEGGGDQSNEEAAFKVAIGAAGGAAFAAVGEALPRVFEKVRSAFKARSDPLNSADLGPEFNWNKGHDTEDADWWFAADREIPGTPTNQRLLSSGSTPVDPPGGPPPGGGPAAPTGWNAPTGDAAADAAFGVRPQVDPSGQPISTDFRLMSPERAAMTEKINGLTEQRDVARRLAETDGMTGLGNFTALQRAMHTVDSDPSLGWAVFDGKQFKAVNDTHGHKVGDQVLMNFARSIEQTAAEMNIPARIFRQGGDEFSAVVPHEQLDAFTKRVTELSTQVVGGVHTKLNGYAASMFNDADLALMGNKRVTNADQITPSNLPTAPLRETALQGSQSEAAALTKQATIMESSAVLEAGMGAEIDESDVVKASLFQNPERINVVQGVGEVGKIIRKLTEGQIEGKLMPHQFRMVERNGQMDMLVSDGLAITPKRVAQYKEHGFFDGQQVTANGRPLQIQKTVSGEGSGTARVYDPYSEESYLVPHDLILPGRHTGSDAEGLSEHGDQLYDRFKQYTTRYMEGEAAKLPAGVTIDTDWMSKETSSQLPQLLKGFLDTEIGGSPVSRAAVDSYFNVRRVQDFQALAPEETAHLQQISRELTQARTVQPIEHINTEELAQHRGMSYNASGDGGGTLVDRNSDLRVDLPTEEAARDFLRNFNRDVPDYSPISEVPVEVVGTNPYAANPGDGLEPVLEGGAEDMSAMIHDSAQTIEDAIDMLGGSHSGPSTQAPPGAQGFPGAQVPPAGGGAGSPPPPPRGPTGVAGTPNPVPPNQPAPSLGQQFARIHRNNPHALQQASDRFDSAWFNLMTPFRSAVLQIEQDLMSAGVSQGNMWKQYSDVVNARVQAHNDAIPWHSEYADIMSQFNGSEGRHWLRTGEVMRNHMIVNQQAKTAAMQAAGYDASDMAAQARVDDFFDRFLSDYTGDPLANYRATAYMNDVRARQATPGITNPFSDTNNRLTPELRFFQDMLTGTNMQLRQIDARMLGQKMVRAAMFEKHVKPSFDFMKAEWNQAGVPSEFKDFVNDWLEVVKTGHNPGYDVMVQGTRHFLNAMGVPVNDMEVRTLGNIAFSNMYRAQIGGRPDAIFRDSIQPFFSGVRIGFKPIAAAYNRFFTGGQTTQDMIDRGLAGGWLEKGLTRVANADVFEAQMYTPQGLPVLTPGQIARREMLAKLGDMTWAMTPKALRNGLQGTRLDPLHYYTKLGEMNRLVSGDAGWQVADRALTDYQQGMTQLLRSNNPSPQAQQQLTDALLKGSMARVYPQPIQNEFMRLVEAGDYPAAANLMGNEAANMQFRYGQLENPVGIRKMGFTGKAIMQFGTFTQQYVAQMREMAMSPGVSNVEKAKMLTRYGAVQAALGLATAYTGWNFGKWAWHQSVTFAGGPIAQGLYQGAQAATGALATAMDAPTSRDQSEAMRRFSNTTPGDVLGGIAASEFPYTSTGKTLSRTYDALTGINPVEGTARLMITGEQGVQPDIRQFLDASYDRMINHPNDVRHAGPQTHALPVLGHAAPAAYNPADSATPGLYRLNQSGYPVYNSTNRDPNGQVPTHRTDLPSGRQPNETWEQYEKRVLARTDFPQSVGQTTNDPNLLHPEVKDSLTKMLGAAYQAGVPLKINETARSQDRQEYLFQQGRSQPGSVVTWTLTSDHATSRAADLEPAGKDVEAGWKWIQQNAPRFGFSVLGAKDPGHVSMPLAGNHPSGLGQGKGGQQ